jgi:glycosyltransferase involved in cell wall biosynthesis
MFINKSNILLSIIVPVYNTEQYLVACLDSLVNGFFHFQDICEIVIVNDGSPDKSQRIIDKYIIEHPQLFFSIKQQNGGLSNARNNGLKATSGKYIWFVDSDDLIESHNIPPLVELLKEGKADYYSLKAHSVDKNNEEVGLFELGDNLSNTSKEFDFSFQNLNYQFSKHMVWLRIYSKDIIHDIDFPEGKTHEDIHFDIKVLSRHPKIIHTGLYLYRHFFDNPESITNNMTKVKFLSILWIYNDLIDWIGINNVSCLEVMRNLALQKLVKNHTYMMSTKIPFKEKYCVSIAYQTLINKNAPFQFSKNKFSYRKEKLSLYLISNKGFKINFFIQLFINKIKNTSILFKSKIKNN